MFPDDTSKHADIRDDTEEYYFGEHYLHKKTDISVDASSNKYKPEIIGHEELYENVHLQPQYNILVIPENIDSYLPIANTLPENHIFQRYEHKQPSVTTLSTIVDPSFSQPYTYSPDNPIELPPKVYKPESLEIKPTDAKKNFICEEDSYKDGQSRSPKYSYAYSVNGGSYGPIFAKHEDSDGHLTKVSHAKLLIENADYICQGEYSVELPDGRLQTVSYTVLGESDFSASLRYSGKAKHPTQNTDKVKTYHALSQVTTPTPRYVKYIPHKAFQE